MGSLPAVLADTAPPIMVIDQQCRGQWQCHADAHGWHLPVSPRTHGGEGTGDHAQHHRGIGMPVGLGGGARAQPPPQKPVAHHHAPGCGGQREAHGTLLGVLLAPPHLAWLMGLGCRVGFGSGLKSELGFRIGTRGWGPG